MSNDRKINKEDLKKARCTKFYALEIRDFDLNQQNSSHPRLDPGKLA